MKKEFGFRRFLQRMLGISGNSAPEPYSILPEESIVELEKKIDHRFDNREFLRHALTHRSHAYTADSDRALSNERMEFLGDAILGFLVNEHLYFTYPDKSEGELTKIKSLLVCRRVLVQNALRLAIGEHLILSENASQAGVEKKESVLADAVEALIAAVYLDGGMSAAKKLVNTIILEEIEEILGDEDHVNYKSLLQEWIQARFKSPPRYKVSSTSGPDHAKSFSVEVTYQGKVLGAGRGTSKRAAEQEAARNAYELLETSPDYLDEHSEE